MGMHRRFWHMNSRSSQVLLYTGDRGRTPLALSTSCGWSPPHPGFPGMSGRSGGALDGAWVGWGECLGTGGHGSVLTKCAAPTKVLPTLDLICQQCAKQDRDACCPPAPHGLSHSQQPAEMLSSAPSAQSLSPSQSQRSGTHTWVPGQEKEAGPQVLPSA